MTTPLPHSDDLTRFHQEQGERYRVPTRLRARYVAYRASDIAPSVELTEKDVATWYESNGDQRFMLPERIRARQIVVKVAPDAPEAARANKVLRDAWASFFWHPPLIRTEFGIETLERLVDGIRAEGYEFVSLQELRARGE